ncbi:hypothetical protein PG990_004174 [Apiospora arundinis]
MTSLPADFIVFGPVSNSRAMPAKRRPILWATSAPALYAFSYSYLCFTVIPLPYAAQGWLQCVSSRPML